MNIYIDPGTTESGIVFDKLAHVKYSEDLSQGMFKKTNQNILSIIHDNCPPNKVVIELPVIYQKADSHLIDTILFVGQVIEASKPVQVYFVTRIKILNHLFKYSGGKGAKGKFGDKETAPIIEEYFKLKKRSTDVDVRAALALLLYEQTGGLLQTLEQIRAEQKIEKDKKRARTKLKKEKASVKCS